MVNPNCNQEREIWKDVVGWEGFYQVSNLGRVKSLTRRVVRSDGRVCWCQGQILKLNTSHNQGYLMVSLVRNSKYTHRLVHHLVLEAFVGPRIGKQEGCHEDGIKRNNRADNLRWDSRQGNCKDRVKHGVNGHKLAPDQIKKIRRLRQRGLSQQAIADRFGVSQVMIGNIVRGDSWFNV